MLYDSEFKKAEHTYGSSEVQSSFKATFITDFALGNMSINTDSRNKVFSILHSAQLLPNLI